MSSVVQKRGGCKVENKEQQGLIKFILSFVCLKNKGSPSQNFSIAFLTLACVASVRRGREREKTSAQSAGGSDALDFLSFLRPATQAILTLPRRTLEKDELVVVNLVPRAFSPSQGKGPGNEVVL